MLECHPHATTLSNFKLPVDFDQDQFADLSTYKDQNWRENVYSPIGDPNGQLERIEFERCSLSAPCAVSRRNTLIPRLLR